MAQKVKYIVAKVVQFIANTLKICGLVNFLLFMFTHKGRSFEERLIGVEMKRVDPEMKRNIDFMYISR